MGIINRFLLFFYTLFFALLSLGLIVLCTGIIPIDDLWNNALYMLSRFETIGAAVVIFLLSIELMGNCFSVKKDSDLGNEGIIVHGNNGEVHITKNAVLDVTNRLCHNMPGVYDTKIKVKFLKKANHIEMSTQLKIRLIIGQEYDAIRMSDELQKNIKDQLSSYMSLNDVAIDIIVDSVSDSSSVKKRRVV